MDTFSNKMDAFTIHFSEQHEELPVWKYFLNNHAGTAMMLGVVAIVASYSILHRIFLMTSMNYKNNLNKEQQLEVVQLTVESIFLSICSIPLCSFVDSLFFEGLTSDWVVTTVPTFIVIMFLTRVMYLTEIASRFSNMERLALLQKFCAICISIYPSFFVTVTNMKTSSVLMYFNTYEVIIFLGMIMSRLSSPTNRWTQSILLTGIITFGLSRPIQVWFVAHNLVEACGSTSLAHVVFQIGVTALFTTVQLFTLSNHWSLYQDCGKRMQEASKRVAKKLELPDGICDLEEPLLHTIQEETNQEAEYLADALFCVCPRAA